VDVVLIPLVVAGALLGRWMIPHIHQVLFDRIVLVLTIVGAAYLLVP
jgi:uncharacterized membrane protein YfcA